MMKKLVSGIFIKLLVLVVVIGTASFNSLATVQPALNLSKLTGYQGEATIAIDPTNPNRMFASSNLSTNGLFAAYSTDGGASWQYLNASKNIAAGGADGLPIAFCDPSAVFDKFGNLYLAYLTVSPVRVVIASSGDGGLTWTQRLHGSGGVLAEFPLVDGPSDHENKRMDEKDGDPESVISQPGDQPTVAVGPGFIAGQGSVWLTWENSGIKVAGTNVTGLGAIGAFPAPTSLTIGGSFGDIEVGPAGQVLVTAGPNSGQTGGNINVSLDPDGLGPVNFTEPIPIVREKKWSGLPDFENFSAAILATTTLVGGFDVIPAQNSRTVDSEPDLAWDRSGGANSGRVYLAYTDEAPQESNDTNIFVRRSNDSGLTWSAPVRVNDDAGTNSQFFPKIEVDQTTGTVAVAFYDCRNDVAGNPVNTDATVNNQAQVYGGFSSTGAVSFSANERIGSGASKSASFGNANEYGDYNGIAFRSGNAFYIWADNSNSTGDNANGAGGAPDLYTARWSPTVSAAGVSVSGRVVTANGNGIRNAIVTLTDQNGNQLTTLTSSFGHYSFEDVAAGATYFVSVGSKRFTFANPTQIVSAIDNVSDIDFIAE